MKHFSAFLFFAIFICSQLFSQSSTIPYYSRYDFQSASPGALNFGLYGFDNPAALTNARGFNTMFAWSDRARNSAKDDWGLFLATPNGGFGVIQERFLPGLLTRYNTSLAFGNKGFSGGFSYSWANASSPLLDHSNFLTVGILSRPTQMLSFGGTFSQVTNADGWNGQAEVGVRPLSNELVTLFGEYILQRMPQVHNNVWSAGAVVEPISGLRIIGRYFDHGAVNVGIQLNLGNIGFESQGHFDENQSHSYNTYAVRIGAYDGSLAELFASKKSKYIGLNFGGTINYQRFEFFDNTKTLSTILSALNAAKNDPEVAGIAINTSGMDVNRELLWEIREKIKECKSAGKKVIIFIDRGNIDLYHFASVADKVVMDPLGTIMLEGYVMGRTYLKGSLEKLGIGFDEWRFFKYKSANESFSRENMSDADREQRQALVDAWYSIAQKEICESRNMTTASFDSLVNNVVALSADDARALGLVDSIGRWETIEEMVKAETKSDNGWKSLSSSQQAQEIQHDEAWGEAPKIAVIYALGVCDMNQGISARSLVKDVDNAVNDANVKAIVLRVDSPGGDALASDYIAEALKKAKGKKPVIISQGFVAASGGYWLSMYGDTIVAAPGTITGSIGVIGGWVYNKGMKEYLGMSTDFVKAGAHADLGFGMQMPILGLTMPDRNLTLEERSHVETMIRNMYKEFVSKVSTGRKMEKDSIAAIAQGRVWSGIDGNANGLVDVLGGLETAIDIAKKRAGILPMQYVQIVEMPKKGLFDLSIFMPKLFGFNIQTTTDPTLEMFKFRLEQNGKPLPMLPLEDSDMLLHSGY